METNDAKNRDIGRNSTGATESARPHFDRAVLLADRGAFADALTCLAVFEDPAESEILALRAWCLENLKRREEAFWVYREALERDPSNLNAREGLANHLWDVDREDEARTHWTALAEQVAAQWTPSSRSLELAGWSLYRLARLPEAEQVLRQACALAPQNPSPRFDLGLVWLAAGRHQEADAAYMAALSMVTEQNEAAIGVARDDLENSGLPPEHVARVAAILESHDTDAGSEAA